MRRFFCSVMFLIACLTFLKAAGVSAQSTAPSWLVDKEIMYPNSRYISAVGEGINPAAAENTALALISRYFDTQVNTRNELIREFNEAVRNNTTDFSSKTYINESAVISSEQEFLCVRFTAPHSHVVQNQQVYSVLAYIDRIEASRTYETIIANNIASITALSNDAVQETEIFYKCCLFFRALKIANLTEEYIKTALLLDPSSAGKYSPHSALIQEVRSRYRANRERMSFNVDINADISGRVGRKMQQLLESMGFIVNRRNSQYIVYIDLDMPEEVFSGGVFVRPGITIQVERDDNVIHSYSKNYSRYDNRQLNIAARDIEKDLEENFLTQLTALIGR